MEDPEPWIKIPGLYKELNTESEEGNGNMTSLKVSLNDKLRGNQFSISEKVFPLTLVCKTISSRETLCISAD